MSKISNLNGQIWIFWARNYNTVIVHNTDQQITIKMHNPNICKDFFITVVYAKCTPGETKDLWEDLESVH